MRRDTVALPAVLVEGALLDALSLEQTRPDFTDEANWQVWLASGASADVVTRPARVGLNVDDSRTVAGRVAVLSRQGLALAFVLLVVSAVAAAVLAAVGASVSIGASARRRSYELAALRALGVPRRRLFGAATVLSVPAGFLAGQLALPVLPEFADATPV